MRYFTALGVVVTIYFGLPNSLAGEAKVARPDENTTRLEGTWRVCSASYQTTGPIYYTFRGNQLTIESRQAKEKRLDSPQQVWITHWTIEIDRSISPHRLIMTKRDEPRTKWVEAFEIRDGEIWMCRDVGDPITSAMLMLGKCGWLTGLSRRR